VRILGAAASRDARVAATPTATMLSAGWHDPAIESTLASIQVSRTLEGLRALGEREDPLYRERVSTRESELGLTLSPSERGALADDAPLAISAEVGEVLHALVLTARPSLIVEFGASLGISTIYLASALADLGAGKLITTELLPAKAKRTESTIAAAGLGRYVEMRCGDARETLADIDQPVGFLFLDGANDLYLPILELLTPRLAPTAVITADMSVGDRDHDRYRAYVNNPDGALIATELRLDAGLVIATPKLS
jgi:predicted O-methyltransferase YrrM